MSRVAGYILRLPEDQESLLVDSDEDYFVEPVSEFEHSRNIPLITFIIDSSERLKWVANGKRGQTAGTGLRKLKLTNIREVDEAISSHDLPALSSIRIRRFLSNRLSTGGLLPPATFQELLRIVSELSPSTGKSLSAYSKDRAERINRLSIRAKHVIAEQKEAVATSMSIAGIDRGPLLEWDIAENVAPTSFLDGLSQVRLREDPMVINDAYKFPGFEAIRSTPFNSVVFESELRRLTVLITNHQPLEKSLGVDLIYYNETFHAFLMVQYKAMEKEGDEAIYRFPNDQLYDELNRMSNVLKELNKLAVSEDADNFRFSDNPFFLKLCPRIDFDPDNTALVKGMYLPLGYWNLISKHKTMKGPKEGLRISYSNVRRYFDNTSFALMAADAWIGTTSHQSEQLEKLIRSTLESGREVVFSVVSDKHQRHISS